MTGAGPGMVVGHGMSALGAGFKIPNYTQMILTEHIDRPDARTDLTYYIDEEGRLIRNRNLLKIYNGNTR